MIYKPILIHLLYKDWSVKDEYYLTDFDSLVSDLGKISRIARRKSKFEIFVRNIKMEELSTIQFDSIE